MQNGESPVPPPAFRALHSLFWEWFKIALFVVGGGYAIIAVADEVFGRKLKWLREGVPWPWWRLQEVLKKLGCRRAVQRGGTDA